MASNQTTPTGHAELYRADFISLMKLPDTVQLGAGAYLSIKDPWRTEWEKGVQVCMNPESLPMPSISVVENEEVEDVPRNFVMPPEMVKEGSDCSSTPQHDLYDLDELDLGWLESLQKRKYNGLTNGQEVSENTLRLAIATLEVKCQHNMAYALTKREDLKMEVDESAGCDVCREFESEDSNEMVFCDGCNVCVHQACYGIGSIPDGSWLCDICQSKKGVCKCVLCPNAGGAMKATGSEGKWAHVSCALWIPEVKFGSPEVMKPILVDQVPVKRWNLICSLCRKKEGACIQCYCASCTVAYHVSCAFKFGLEMRTSTENQDRLIYESYCPKHTTLRKAIRTPSPKKDLGLSLKVRNLEEEFHRHASPADLQRELNLSERVSSLLYNYWQLKRKANQNRPLVAAMSVDSLRLELLQQSQDLAQKKANFDELVLLRHNLEKLRNLVYMVQKRERLKKQLLLREEEVVLTQLKLVDVVHREQKESSCNRTGVNNSATPNGPLSEVMSNDGFRPPSVVPILDYRITRQMLKHGIGTNGESKVVTNDTSESHQPMILNSKLELNQLKLNSKLDLKPTKLNSKLELNQSNRLTSSTNVSLLRGRHLNSDPANATLHQHL